MGDFFLPERGGGDGVFLGPRRDGITVECFVDGHDTFAAMELSLARARTSVFFATWMFGSTSSRGVRLISPARVRATLRSRGINARPATWVDLLEVLARHGVDVRVILADFDAVMAPGLHRSTWLAHETILRAASRVERVAGARTLHVLASLHPTIVDTLPFVGIDSLMRPRLTETVGRIANLSRANRLAELRQMPGTWPFIDVSATLRPTVKASPSWRMFPVSHHQKLLVIDAQIAYCGGLDLAVPRADTQRHDSAVRRWHDVHCRVDGAAAQDFARGFVGRWTLERAQFDARIGALSAAQPSLGLSTQVPTRTLADAPPATASAGSASVQMLRTVSRPGTGLAVSDRLCDDVERSYRNAIERAEKYVYIENQYLRYEPIADWVLTAANASSALEVIVVVPVAPEEVTATGEADEITEDGMAMQARIIDELTAALNNPGAQARFGAFSIVARARRGKRSRPTDAPSPTPPGFPSRQIYLHSKVLAIDDQFAIVGSANANPRSFQIDTEACVAFHDPARVAGLRLALWRELLGNPAELATWPAGSWVPRWNAIAAANRTAATPRNRQGFVIPHDNSRFPGANHPLIPDMYAGLTEEVEVEDDAFV
ncbi:phospholipase D-like domain-containing protein [Blastococcus deserti]|uniref:Phosphatidylserine/phosphatidylglycerophosphate/ cardiolipin synthase family protein n=1 Tax=Blastococcus deserti TaxID=2259033 RepID=A0ABW4XEK1_9ACTN